MRNEETLLLYLLVGLAVGATLAWREPRLAPLWLTLGVLFWPIFLPLLFSKPKKPKFIDELDSLRAEAERLGPLLPELEPLPAAIEAAAQLRAGTEDLGRLLHTQEEALRVDEPAPVRESRAADLERIRSALTEQEARYLKIVSRVREAVTQAHLARYSAESRRELGKQMARLSDEMTILEMKTGGAA